MLPNFSEGVELYDATTYTRLAYYGMPGFATDSATLRSGVRFVFFTRDGQQLDVLVAALTDQPVSSRFGFVRVPITSVSP